MSQETISQKIKRTCEGCGVVKEYELVGATEETVNDMTQWYTVIREVLDPEQGKFAKLLVQSCSLECVPSAAAKLALTPQSNREDREIDLKLLRASSNDPTIN